MTPLRVLMLEDRAADADLIARELRRSGFDPDWTRVQTEAEFAAGLDARPDVVLADFGLPGWNSEAALKMVQARGSGIPFIVVSGTIGEEAAVAMMRQGAADYLLKDRLARLGPAVAQAIENRRMRDEQRALEATVRETEARAVKELLAANRTKDAFLATLSHEFRTPLNAILGYARMLNLGMLSDEKQTHAIEVIERNAASLGEMVNDVLDVSRIVSGKLRLNLQPVEVDHVVREVVASVLPTAEVKGIRVETVADPRGAVASADPDRLRQVIWNLLANAVKFTPCGGRVDVRVDLVGNELRVIVSDTGIGIPTETLPHVFERFWQADSSSTREHGGLGLGLALARNIVEMHGGQLEASSRGVGQGATFVVRLPVTAVSDAGQRNERRRSPASGPDVAAATSRALAGLRIMVVDDDLDALAMVREILEFSGADVITTSSGSQALERLEALDSAGADVLVIDLAMPVMDGLTLIDRIQASQKSIHEIPAAALTAYARTEDRVRALRRGFRMHLTKPIHPTELVAAVAALAGRVPTADADDRPSPSGRRTRTRVRR